MATTFLQWTVDDVKRWIITWHSQYSVGKQTIYNVIKAADAHRINGQRLIYCTSDDLKKCGLNNKDINITIMRIDSLVVGSYVDYMLQRYSYYRYLPQKRIKLKQSKTILLHQPPKHTRHKMSAPDDIKQQYKETQYKSYKSQRKTQTIASNKKTDYNPFWSNNDYIENNANNREAVESIASNKNVHIATRSAMKDDNIRNAAWSTYHKSGNDPHTNRKLIRALAQNKAVQSATISVAKDKKVQKAAYQTARKNATKENASKMKGIFNFNV